MDLIPTLLVANTVIAAFAVLISFLGLRQGKSTHLTINSRFDRWLKIEREQGNTAGREAEKQEAKNRENIPIKRQ